MNNQEPQKPALEQFGTNLTQLAQEGKLDPATINTLAAFQMHYRPALHDGQPDLETAAIMLAML